MEIAAPAPAAAAPVAAMAPAPAPVPAAPVPVPVGLDPQAVRAVENADAKETREAERQDGNASVAPKPNVAEPGGGRAAAEDPPAGNAAPGGQDAHQQDALQQPSAAAQAPPPAEPPAEQPEEPSGETRKQSLEAPQAVHGPENAEASAPTAAEMTIATGAGAEAELCPHCVQLPGMPLKLRGHAGKHRKKALAQAPSAQPPGPTGAQAPVPRAAKQSWVPAGVWYAQETEMLLQLVAAEGPNDWEGKAKRLGTGRTAKAVSTRWLRATGRIKDRRPSSVANRGLPGAPKRVAPGAQPAPRPRPAAQQSSPDEPAGDNITQLGRPARARVPTRKVVENASSATQRTPFSAQHADRASRCVLTPPMLSAVTDRDFEEGFDPWSDTGASGSAISPVMPTPQPRPPSPARVKRKVKKARRWDDEAPAAAAKKPRRWDAAVRRAAVAPRACAAAVGSEPARAWNTGR